MTWDHSDPTAVIVFLILGYLCGTIAFGLILTKLFGLGDLRSIGSGNIGATNVLRTGNKKVAAMTLLGDLLKATVPIWVAWKWGAPAAAAAGFGAFLGHLFPVWLGFKGGKGVATYIGVLLGLRRSAFWSLPPPGSAWPRSSATPLSPHLPQRSWCPSSISSSATAWRRL